MKKINETFTCVHCWYTVPLASKTCRNHCPKCFVSLHVDGETPGDRKADCQSQMFPSEFFIANGETKILFVCSKCWKKHYNKATEDDDLTQLNDLIHKYKRLLP